MILRRTTPAIRAWRHTRVFTSPGDAGRIVALSMLLAVIAGCSNAPSPAQLWTRPQGGGHSVGMTQLDPQQAQGHSNSASTANQADWLRFNDDPAHSGSVPATQTLSVATIGGPHLLWRAEFPDTADSAPVYLHGMVFPDQSQHDVLYVTTKDGTLVAVDAGTGYKLWSVHTAGPEWTTSSPAADPSRCFVYFYGLDGFVHKVGAVDGKEIKTGGWPVRVTNIPGREKGSAPLDIVNRRLYAALSTYAPEVPPNQGHLVVIDLANASTHVFNTVCSNIKHLLTPTECASSGGGIWARASAVLDPVTGNIFVATANAPFDGRVNWGDSVLELSADGTRLLDSYAPIDNEVLYANNWDLGSTAPALLPQIPGSKTPYLLVQGGKDGVVRLLNRQNLSGKSGPGHVGGELQMIPNPGCTMFTQPAVWQEPNQGATWVFAADICDLTGYQVVTDQHGDTRLHQAWRLPVLTTSPVLTGGVLFAATKGELPSARPSSLGAIHWESPMIVGGKVYLSDENGALLACGL